MRERISWIVRALAATNQCDHEDFASLYQELLDRAAEEDSSQRADTIGLLIIGLMKQAVERGHVSVEIGLHLMERGVSKWENNPDWHNTHISKTQDDSTVDFDIFDGQALPGHIKNENDFVALRKASADGTNPPWPNNYWLLPAELPPNPMINVSAFYMRTGSDRSNDYYKALRESRDDD